MQMIKQAIDNKLETLLPTLIDAGDLINYWELSQRLGYLSTPRNISACLRNCPELRGDHGNVPGRPSGAHDDRDEGGTPTAAAVAEKRPRKCHDDAYIDRAITRFLDCNNYVCARICALTIIPYDNPANSRLLEIGEAALAWGDYWTAYQCIEESGNIRAMVRLADKLAETSAIDDHVNSNIIIRAYLTVGEVRKLISYGDQLRADRKWYQALEAYLSIDHGAGVLAIIDALCASGDRDDIPPIIDRINNASDTGG